MQISEDEHIRKCGKQCKHCSRFTLLPNEYEFNCFSFGYNVIKRKRDFKVELQGKKYF